MPVVQLHILRSIELDSGQPPKLGVSIEILGAYLSEKNYSIIATELMSVWPRVGVLSCEPIGVSCPCPMSSYAACPSFMRSSVSYFDSFTEISETCAFPGIYIGI